MRLVLDQGVPRDAATLLRGLGHECAHLGEIGMSKAADEEILAFSREKDAIAVTLDADFHTILAVSQGQVDLAGFEADLKRGSLVTVKAHKTTCHRLPAGAFE